MFRVELKRYREIVDLTQKQLGEKIGVSQATVGMWESGKREPDFDTLCDIADFFNISTDSLLGRTVSTHSSTVLPSDILTDAERRLLAVFSSLNDEGQAKVFSYIEDLHLAGIYKRDHSAGVVSKQA